MSENNPLTLAMGPQDVPGLLTIINKLRVDLNKLLLFIPNISTGLGAPSTTPVKPGDIYVDTQNNAYYGAVGNASSSSWLSL